MTTTTALRPCPVCVDISMQIDRLGPAGELEIDHCLGCGGLWLDYGEIQQLRALPLSEVRTALPRRNYIFKMNCHACEAPLDRDDPRCQKCGWENILNCPACHTAMEVEEHADILLDFCRSCKGVWFDHDELKSIWVSAFDRSRQQKSHSGQDFIAGGAVDAATERLFDAIFSNTLSRTRAQDNSSSGDWDVDVASNLDADVLDASVLESAAEATSSVFEAILGVLGGLFDGL